MQIPQETTDYILSFLLYGHDDAHKKIIYTEDEPKKPVPHSVVIIRDKEKGLHYPNMHQVQTESKGTSHIIRTDIVYNTFFFISRAEEVLNSSRDQHGRFLAKHSITEHGNQLQIPIIDEYSRLLLKLLNIQQPENRIAKVCLTHDVDTLTRYRNIRGTLGGIYRGETKQAIEAWRDINNDPYFTFRWLIKEDTKIKDAEQIYFIKHTQGKGYDYPQYNLKGHDFKILQAMLAHSGAKTGLHSSYYGSIENMQDNSYTMHRSHYLRCTIEQMRSLPSYGITDDYSMGFADMAGFRLQTTRPVRWIDPETLKVTPLTLHPLSIMDCTLSNSEYMNLSEDEAYFCCQRIIDKVKLHNGELVLLWHNSNINGTYHKSLYPKILELI